MISRRNAGVALLLALYWIMAVSVSPHMGVTADEPGHLTAGYSYWRFHDYRLSPEAGNLPMRVAALPLLAMDLRFPATDSVEWQRSDIVFLGRAFFFDLGNPYSRMLLASRAAIALFGVFTLWLVWRWSRALFGPVAGWVSLVLAAFCPALLAHGALVTSDMALTTCLLAALTAFWRLIHVVTWGRLALATLACGAVLLAKMSGVLAAPMLIVLLIVRWLRPAPLVLRLGRESRWLRSRLSTIAVTLGLAVAVAAGSLVVLWGAFGFRYSAFGESSTAADRFTSTWPQILGEQPMQPQGTDSGPPSVLAKAPPTMGQTNMFPLIRWVRDHRLLPEAYLWGVANTYLYSRARVGFLNGEVRNQGWPQFFPLAFLMKTSVPAMLFAAGGFVLLLRPTGRKGRDRCRLLHRAAPLLVLFVIYWAIAIPSKLNIGHRHILPIYPVIYVVAGASAAWLLVGPARRWGRFAVGLAVFAHAVDSFASRPIYLSYFNTIAGGTNQGWRHLVDSSYDWGQGLPDLERWIAEKKARGDSAPVFLTYMGMDSPKARALPVTRFADAINDQGLREFPALPRGGWFVIAASHFHRIYLHLDGPWTREREQLYRDLGQRLMRPAGAAASSPGDVAEQVRVLHDAQDFEVLMFGRICHYLSQSEPDDVIGGSLLVFRLTDAEVGYALNAPFDIFRPAGPRSPARPARE